METAPKDYHRADAVVSYDAKRCIHAKECVHGLPQVFDPKSRPWIKPEHASPDQLATVIARCPTGALHLRDPDGRSAEPPVAGNTATIAADGPIYLRSDVEIVDADGKLLLKDTRVALCRCGASRNKPLCDGSHTAAGFRDAGQFAGELKIEPGAATGPVRVTASRNGPLGVSGAVTLMRADGTAGAADTEFWLCRCGGSQQKPFCDGTHKKIGFVG